ncbi:hypothetical protein [Limnoglobus roseus]|uniref:Uncharacterized protein n=1 Tax=Limnoglobus roseus TaxID=2598579 RepID=A0A5C1A6L3_9BACT|nr:hypothetical protein [Limnoglobus roseus]QEL14821.1 hypothetical protein PX52LOC_01719 [Limnoglobus roseus]
MRGTGLVSIGTELLYAFYSVEGRSARLRVSIDEFDRLDLFQGKPVRIGLPEQEPRTVLVMAVSHAPPFAWVEVEATGMLNRAG